MFFKSHTSVFIASSFCTERKRFFSFCFFNVMFHYVLGICSLICFVFSFILSLTFGFLKLYKVCFFTLILFFVQTNLLFRAEVKTSWSSGVNPVVRITPFGPGYLTLLWKNIDAFLFLFIEHLHIQQYTHKLHFLPLWLSHTDLSYFLTFCPQLLCFQARS